MLTGECYGTCNASSISTGTINYTRIQAGDKQHLGVQISTGYNTCSEPEASISAPSFRFLTPDNSLFDEVQGNDRRIAWEYNPFRVGDNICLCGMWQVGYSQSSADVWSDSGAVVEHLPCPTIDPESPQLQQMHWDAFKSDTEFGSWGWLSARQIGTNESATAALTPIRVCLRRGISIKPTLEPSALVFFGSQPATILLVGRFAAQQRPVR